MPTQPSRTARAAAALCVLLITWTAVALVRPSWACGCGAMVTSGGELRVDEETSIVRYDDRTRTEQIVMRLAVRSDVRDAAWLFPTPSPARVTTADRTWFDRLDALTRPRTVTHREWWARPEDGDGAAGAAAPGARGGGVRVLGEQRLGPFEVATLAGRDPRGLSRWLRGHGYALSPRLAGALRPYAERGWSYVAVKLAPGSGRSANGAPGTGAPGTGAPGTGGPGTGGPGTGGPGSGRALEGALDPLHVTFRSDELVYPMRLSGLARNDQSVHLYVLGAHRVEHRGPRGAYDVSFAGRVRPDQVSSPGLRTFLGGPMFLTEVVNRGLRPSEIDDDFRYPYTTDRTHREVDARTEYVTFLGLPAGWVILVAAGLILTAGTGLAFRRTLR